MLLNKGFYIAFSQTCIVSASNISEFFVEIVISIEHQWLLLLSEAEILCVGVVDWS